MRETTEEQQLAAEQAAREQEEQKEEEKKKDGQATLAQRLAQARYYETLVKRGDQKAQGAFAGAGVEGLVKLLGDHVMEFEKTPDGAFKLSLNEDVEVGGVVFESVITGRLGAREVIQISGVRAKDGRRVERMTGEGETVVAHTDSEPIQLTPEAHD